ncbi:hypothetical protein ACQJBY_015853 [Aegilops geniculata]
MASDYDMIGCHGPMPLLLYFIVGLWGFYLWLKNTTRKIGGLQSVPSVFSTWMNWDGKLISSVLLKHIYMCHKYCTSKFYVIDLTLRFVWIFSFSFFLFLFYA